MKIKLLLSLSAFFCSVFFTFADQPGIKKEKCGFVSHLEYLKLNNPGLEQQMIKEESQLQQALSHISVSRVAGTVYTIPVVVHVVYRLAAENISDAQILSQIDALNEDFARTNADSVNTPAAFQSVASATNFQFCMAQQDPNGLATNGIERRLTTTHSFSTNDNVKHFSSGGLDIWDANRYLNIWVCNMGGGILGYGEFPAVTHTNTYGVVIQFDAFGRTGVAASPYDLGRTCTHEISHCFRLYHIWGDDNGTCTGTDNVNDTPNQGDATYGCYTFPHTDNCATTAPGIMFMNYMDYSDDNCLNMFTANQASRMFAAISADYPLLLTSNACQRIADGVAESPSDFDVSIYPNPSSGVINLDMFTTKNIGSDVHVKVTDIIGKIVHQSVIHNPNGYNHQIDLHNNSNGVYIVTIYNDNYKKTERITIAR